MREWEVVTPSGDRQSVTPSRDRQSIGTRSVASKARQSPVACSPLPESSTSYSGRSSEDAELVTWCFRRTREEIQERLDALDRSNVTTAKRASMYVERKPVESEDSLIGRFVELAKRLRFDSFPKVHSAAALDMWSWQDGGKPKTSELLQSLEVLNFYRWFCGISSVRLDSCRQEVAEIVLEVLMKRAPQGLDPHVASHVESFVKIFEEFFEGANAHPLLVISQMPSATSAARRLFSSLAAGYGFEYTGSPPSVSKEPLLLPRASEVALKHLVPFLQLGLPGHEPVPEPQWQAALSPRAPILVDPRRKGRRYVHVPERPPSDLPSAVKGDPHPIAQGLKPTRETGGQRQRRMREWGDLRGAVSFRRTVLDPRLEYVGIFRLGCSTCFWVPHSFEGEPECVANGTRARKADFLDYHAGGAFHQGRSRLNLAQASLELNRLSHWRETLKWRRLSTMAGGEKSEEPTVTMMKAKSLLLKSKTKIIAVGAVPDVFGKGFEKEGDPFDIGIEIPFARRCNGHGRLATHEDHSESSRPEGRASLPFALRISGTESLGPPRFHEELSEKVETPLMVSFPPPGLCPLELFQAHQTPWSVSPNPLRLAPTPACAVQIHRVHINFTQSSIVRRAEVPLANFCVDWDGIGTAFCIVFTPDVELADGDQFEVVVSGLAHKLRPSEAACDLRYLVAFEHFSPPLHSLPELRSRSAKWLDVLGQDFLWQPVVWTTRDPGGGASMAIDRGVMSPESGHRVKAGRSEAGRRGGLLSSKGGNPNVAQSVELHKQLTALPETDRPSSRSGKALSRELQGRNHSKRGSVGGRTLRFNENLPRRHDNDRMRMRPPVLGYVPHRDGVSDPKQALATVKAATGNEVYLALVAPANVLLKGTLRMYIPTTAKWEDVPRAVMTRYFQETSGLPAEPPKNFEALFTLTVTDDDQQARVHRVILQVLLPLPGQFHVELHWAPMPLETASARGLVSHSPYMDHSIRILISAPAASSPVVALVPHFMDATLLRFGYPTVNSLADHFGVSLISPMRHRLRTECVRFTVLVTQANTRCHEAWNQTLDGEAGSSSSSSDQEEDSRDCVARVGPRLRRSIATQIRCGVKQQVAIVVVVDNWKKVEVLQRRTLIEEVPSPTRIPPPNLAEVHETVLRLTPEDRDKSVQLLVFQVGQDLALERELARAQNHLSTEPKTTSSTSVSHHRRRHHNGVPELEDSHPPLLGSFHPPNYWTLAEFRIDSVEHLGYDEDEMRPLDTPVTEAVIPGS